MGNNEPVCNPVNLWFWAFVWYRLTGLVGSCALSEIRSTDGTCIVYV